MNAIWKAKHNDIKLRDIGCHNKRFVDQIDCCVYGNCTALQSFASPELEHGDNDERKRK